MQEPNDDIPVARTLDDISDETAIITIPKINGGQVQVELRILSEQEVWEIHRSMTWPKPPMDVQKVNGVIKRLYNYEDEKYISAVKESDRLFSLKMLLAMLQVAIPGETEQEKLAALRKRLGHKSYRFLVEAANEMNNVNPQEVAEMVNKSFRRPAGALASGNGAAGADAGAVAATTEGG